MTRLWLTAILAFGLTGAIAAEPFTEKHESGRCAIGTCGDRFNPIPCVNNGLAGEPEEAVRKQLVGLCGPKWSSGPICCAKDQVNISVLKVLIWSC